MNYLHMSSLAALADPTRRRIVELLSEGERTITLDTTPPTVTAAYATVHKAGSPSTVGIGTTVTWTLDWSISEYYTTTDILLTDVLPDGMTYITNSASLAPAQVLQNTPSTGKTTIVWELASARTGQRWDGNQELIGQGLAKLTASVCQAYPVSGSFGRSAFLLAAGARTGLASVVGAVMVLAALLAAPELIARIPRPVLAAVIFVTLSALLSPKPLQEAWQASRDDGLAGTVSFAATLLLAPHIEIGILSGLILSLAFLIYRSMTPRVALLGRHDQIGACLLH